MISVERWNENIDKILEWVSCNHFHHEFSEGVSINLGTGEVKDIKLPEFANGCMDNEYPYVNSEKLKRYIEKTRIKVVDEKISDN